MAKMNKGAVFAALVGNGFLTLIKFGAFVLSGSGAMLSEAIHSLADSGNQFLLYLGIRRSERPPDELYPYGYGGDRFVFALLSAMGIFVLGCGVTVYHGVHGLLHPPKLSLSWITFAVLALSFLVEGYVFWKAVRQVQEVKGDRTFGRFFKTSSDPTLLAVLFEDAVALLGILIAAIGIAVSYLTGDTVFDSLSSILIGLLLGAVSIWLGLRNRQLLLGPAIPRHAEKEIIEFLNNQPTVLATRAVKSRIVGANRFRISVEIDYNGRHLARSHIEWAAERIIQATDSKQAHSLIEELGEALLDSLGKEVDRLEAEIRKRFPAVRNVDLESD